MSDVLIRVFAGLCGASLFAVINRYTVTLSGWSWLAATAGVFAAAFLAALTTQRRLQPSSTAVQTIASRNTAGGALKVRVDGAPSAGPGGAIGSENQSAGDMDIGITGRETK